MAALLEILGQLRRSGRRRGRPLYGSSVQAGFPSPADDYIDRDLDLNEYLIERPAATFFVRARGYSMTGSGIHDGDILIVDRAAQARDGSVVIAAVDGELAVKRIGLRGGRLLLEPDNDAYPPIEVGPEADFQIWGVCRHVIHPL